MVVMAVHTKVALTLTLGIAASALIAFSGSVAAPAVELRGAGSTLVAPLIGAWTKGLAASHPNVSVQYEQTGSGEGIYRFLADTVQFGATERPMTDAEINRAERGVVHVPVTAGMVAVAYNLPDVSTQLRLGRETLAEIFSGAVRQWNDPRISADNPGVVLPARTIALVTRRDASGTTYAFTAHLAAVDPTWSRTGPGVGDQIAWPPETMTVLGSEGVASRVSITENSIGYIEYGFARRLGLKTALLQNRDGAFVGPAPAAGAAALADAAANMPPDGRQLISDPAGTAAYPIVTYTWLLLRQNGQSADVTDALRAFVGYGLSPNGQAQAAEIGYAPLPSAVVERAEALLGRMR